MAISGGDSKPNLRILLFALAIQAAALSYTYAGTISAAPNPPQVYNSVIDVGGISYVSTAISGNSPPFTGNWLWQSANVASGNTLTYGLPSSNVLTLSVNAVSYNTVILTSNGVQYTVTATGSNGIYGVWTFNGFASDSSSNTVQIMSNTVTINPALASVGALVSNSALLQGGTESVTAQVSGGTQAYTYNFLVYNGIGLVANALFSGVSSTSNTFSFQVNSLWGTGSMTVNMVVSDSAIPYSSVSNSVGFTVNGPLRFGSFTASNSVADQGQYETLKSSITGGQPPYTYNFLVYNGIGLVANALFSGVSSTSNTFSFQVNSLWGTGVLTSNMEVLDSSSPANSVSNSIAVSVNTPLATPSAPSVNITKAESGQSILISTPSVSGGSPPLHYTLYVANSLSNAVLASMGPQSTANFVYAANSLGQQYANVVASDSATSTEYASSPFSVQFTVANAPTANLLVKSNPMTLGNTSVFTVNVPAGAGFGPFVVNLVLKGTGTVKTVNISAGGIGNTISYFPLATGTYTFNVIVTDEGASHPYTFASSSLNLVVNPQNNGGGGGGGGGGGSGSTSTSTSLTTTTSTTSTSTTSTSTTIPALNYTAGATPTSVNVSEGSPVMINATGIGAYLVLRSSSPSPSRLNVSINSHFGRIPAAPAGYSSVNVLNVSLTPRQYVAATLTLKYVCGISPNSIAPFLLNGSLWVAVTNFSVDAAACSVSFPIPLDPIVALMTSLSQNSGASSSVSSTSVAQTTSVPLPPSSSASSSAFGLAGVVIIIVVIAAVAVFHDRIRELLAGKRPPKVGSTKNSTTGGNVPAAKPVQRTKPEPAARPRGQARGAR